MHDSSSLDNKKRGFAVGANPLFLCFVTNDSQKSIAILKVMKARTQAKPVL